MLISAIKLFVIPFMLFMQSQTQAALNPDSTRATLEFLEYLREFTWSSSRSGASQKANILMSYGSWDRARQVLDEAGADNPDVALAWAWYWYRQNKFQKVEKILNSITEPSETEGPEIVLLQINLLIQAWKLDEALELNDQELAREYEQPARIWHRKHDLMEQRGRIYFHMKEYDKALDMAKQIQAENANHAGSYVLEGDYLIWQQKPAEAEVPLRKALSINPFNADARFLYGYAIWRRGVASQLPDMAAQWEIALQVDPLHYLTHWHWGNGHTQLTYRDYAAPDDAEVREKLEPAEALFVSNRIDEAIEHTRAVGREHPLSVLPWMYRGSYFYSAFDREGEARLDSARAIFEHILKVKPNYGPAHNGLASVIRAQRIPYIAIHDSIMQALRDAPVTDERLFARIFPDMDYYPGQIVRKMAWTQMHTAKAYLPLLDRLGRTFVIPPLHKDLTIAMNSPFFRQSTTFDNRQWMDIRGVGSGAAAIEYVQKAAFLDRNVLLHEFVHLFHGTVLTDYQVRRIRALYYQAMRDGLILDYYAGNNESEYFAQIYPAYFSEQKVHPLDFKSTNTRADIVRKDPQAYAFMDSLVAAERAAIAGDRMALAGNWAQAYVTLSRQVRRGDESRAMALLDTALTWQSDYLPAMLAYADAHLAKGERSKAKGWLDKALAMDPNYAPTYIGLARWVSMDGDLEAAVAQQEEYLLKAYELEGDFMEKAGNARMLYLFYQQNAMVTKSIEMAEKYADEGSTVSTYLRDRIDDAIAIASVLRVELGFGAATERLATLVQRKPQNYAYRKMYADALARIEQYDAANATLEQAQAILRAAGTPRRDFVLKMADYANRAGDVDRAKVLFVDVTTFEPNDRMDALLKIRLEASLSSVDIAKTRLVETPSGLSRYELAEWHYTRAYVLKLAGDLDGSRQALMEAVKANPFHMDAQLMLEGME
jgi:tetratricopeptide (TPR) repeat protein